jgi:membrane associated rhomboid family serine protease
MKSSVDQRRFFISVSIPLLFLVILWTIKYAEWLFDDDYTMFGVYPLKAIGLMGIITSPLIHANIEHLLANSLPLLVLGTGLFFFYYKVAFRVFFIIYFATGIWVWIGGREAYHIGASGLVYGLAFFIFSGGVILRDIRLMAISLLVVFLYGGMFWGIFPIDPKVSWESHLSGGLTGALLAIFYRKQGPPAIRYAWENEELEENEDKGLETDFVQDEDPNNPGPERNIH